MCIVVDINSLASVFNESCAAHEDFRPVKAWIWERRGFLVFGGSRYKEELSLNLKYLKLVGEMNRAGQAIAIRDDIVDEAERQVLSKTGDTDCDDQHIIALLGVSRCPLLCSRDFRSFPFVKDKALYPAGMKKVQIYSSKRNKNLLLPMKTDILKNRV